MFQKCLMAAMLTVCAALGGQQVGADEYVRGYTRSNGTYVAPYYRSDRDNDFSNNWSTYPNINPYTGKMGTRVTPPSSSSRSYPAYDLPRSYGGSSYSPGSSSSKVRVRQR